MSNIDLLIAVLAVCVNVWLAGQQGIRSELKLQIALGYVVVLVALVTMKHVVTA